jgi:hypothetical protein
MLSALLWSLLLALAAALLVGSGAVRLRGTTLAAPAWWAVGSLASIAAVELLAASGLLTDASAGPLRYAAAVTALCPMMAVLGAKRPQDRAWQWVVVALLATLWLPAAKWLLLDSGQTQLFPAWQVFLAVLVLVGPLNYLPTRNWLPSLLVAAGQCLLLTPFVPLLGGPTGEWRLPAVMTAFLAAGLSAWLRTWRADRGRSPAADPLQQLNTAWFCFRDAFGAFWAVRVVQRVNQGLHATGSRLELTWLGWAAVAEAGPSATAEDLEFALDQAKRTLRTGLRRFVRRE